MKEKILALLIASFTGVRKDGLNQLARTLALQATTDEEAKALVDKLTKEQVNEFVKEFRAEVDKEVSESNKTFESNLKKKFDFVEKGNDPEPGGGEPGGGDTKDLGALIKNAISEAVKPLQTELETIKFGNVAKTRLQTLTEKLNSCKNEAFKAKALKDFARMQFETDEEFQEYLTETDTDIQTANQDTANAGLGGHSRPLMPLNNNGDVKEATKEEIDALADKLPI
jgi:hypothetical protein